MDYLITALNVFICGLAVFLALKRGKNSRANHAFWMAWIAGLVSAGLLLYGGEALTRALALGLIPVGFFCVTILRQKKIVLGALLVILILINIPARFGYASNTQRSITDSEISGTAAYARYTPRYAMFFYQGGTQTFVTDPSRSGDTVLGLTYPPWDPKVTEPRVWSLSEVYSNEPAEEVVLRESDYIIDSDAEREEYKYFIGYDFLERLKLSSWGSLWYNNGHVRIYKAFR